MQCALACPRTLGVDPATLVPACAPGAGGCAACAAVNAAAIAPGPPPVIVLARALGSGAAAGAVGPAAGPLGAAAVTPWNAGNAAVAALPAAHQAIPAGVTQAMITVRASCGRNNCASGCA